MACDITKKANISIWHVTNITTYNNIAAICLDWLQRHSSPCSSPCKLFVTISIEYWVRGARRATAAPVPLTTVSFSLLSASYPSASFIRSM